MLKKIYLAIVCILCAQVNIWANDDCANATVITPNVSCSNITGTFNGMTVTNPITTCSGTVTQDVWYSFTATDATNRIQVAPTSVNVAFEVYENSCNSSALFCVNASTGTTTTESNTFTQYVPGNTYYIRVYNAGAAISTSNFTICVIKYPEPANDLCGNSTLLTPNSSCTSVTGTMSGALLDGGSLSCANTASQDVWYHFTATDSTMRINVSPSSSLNVGFEIKENSCLGNTIICLDNSSTGTDEVYFSNSFKPGTTYFVRVFNSIATINTGTFEICVERFPTPVNDICANATTLTPELTCLPITGTFSGSMFNGGASISCGSTAKQDVWYKFVATDTTMNVTLTPTSGLNHGFQILENSCNGNIVSCTNAGGNGVEEKYLNHSFTPGKTYYVRVFNNGNLSLSTFGVCVQKLPRPTNDECANATVITPSLGTCSNIAGTFSGALNSTGSSPVCGNTTTQDVWFRFTATDSTMQINLPSASGINHGFEIVENNCAGATVQCVNTSATGAESYFDNKFKPGTNYFVRVFNNGALRTGNFNICVQRFPSPTNDVCANAINITPSVGGCTNVTGTFSGAMFELGNSPMCATGVTQDIWYKFTATDSTMRINLPYAGGINHGFQVIENSCNGPVVQCVNASASSAENYLNTSFKPNTIYYIQVFNSSPISTENVNVCVERFPTPLNDVCQNAVTLTANSSCNNTTGTFSGALFSSGSLPSCATSVTQDVWYKFAATDSMMRVTLGTASGPNHGFEIIENTCTGPVVACVNNSTGQEVYTSPDFKPNATYFVRVFNTSAVSSNDFNICVISYPAPSNDICANAIPLTVGTTCSNTSGSFSGALLNGTALPTCGMNTSQDVWYSFVATNTSHTVTLSAVTGLDHGFQVFENSCSGNEIVCRNNASSGSTETTAVTNLTIGATYYVRVFNASQTLNFSNFNICVFGAAATNCTPSVSITSNTTTICAGSTVTFTATSLNGGSTPVFQWLLNGNPVGTNSATFSSSSLNNGDVVTCTLTSNASCASSNSTVSSNAIAITTASSIVPTFAQINPICSGESLILPTTSMNGITGTWSPAVNNQATTTYTFTPSSNSCASTATMTVTVNTTLVTPHFNNIAPICIGDIVALPTTSTNAITGTWSPAFNSQTTTTYTFTPNSGQCAVTTTLTITVNGNLLTPSFAQINPICVGSTFSLPTVSLNGVTGSWSPAIDNQNTTTYTFTPNAGQCAVATTMEVVVSNASTTPVFSPISAICAGDFVQLPSTSLNGITGSWSPAANNQATTTYTFTPNGGQCAATATMTVVVNQGSVTPVFNPIGPVCAGDNIALPYNSTNGVSGTWSPVIDNQNTTTYTFTPLGGQCATVTTLTVVVKGDLIEPLFDAIQPVCKGDNISLPLISNNGITGVWSPSLNNNQTTTYTFIPANGQCATITTLTAVVNQVDVDVIIWGNSIAANYRVNAQYQWIDCESNSAVDNAAKSSFTPKENGTYAVVITENNCADTSVCVTIKSIGLNEANEESALSIYPNPVNTNFTLVTSLMDMEASYEIQDVTGRVVNMGKIVDQLQQIDISNYPTGMYFLKLSSRNEIIKVIKQ